MAKLLREYVSLDYDRNLIIEAIEGNKPVVVSALLQSADKLNQNKRIYRRDVLEREFNNYQKVVEENRATGELDHPESSVVNLKNVSHIVREVWWEGNDVRGKIEILDTPSGRIAKDLLKAGVKLGVSSRGVGETTKTNEGYDEVADDYMLICLDLVSEPSTNGAFLGESKEINPNEIKKLLDKRDRINRIVNELLLKSTL